MRLKRTKGILFVISAPSGTGKTTLSRRLLTSLHGVTRSISYTTRPPRQGEAHAHDYHFVSDAVFDRMVSRKEFVEWARVYGFRYGTGKAAVRSALRRGMDIFLTIDVQGARSLSRQFPDDAVTIFVIPPSLGELTRRLMTRGGDARGKMDMRLREAKREIAASSSYDYIVVNNTLQEAEGTLGAIVTAERSRRDRNIIA